MSTKKHNAVCRLSRWSRYPVTFRAIISRLPEAVWSSMTAKGIVQLIDAWQGAYTHASFVGYMDARD
jgi:hypothetical protein